ncbi:MAG: alpha/beta hydrolase [Proteobacteria bacterium]|nr:alpha/beta hydrolase [Pseudomonadota bacterium]
MPLSVSEAESSKYANAGDVRFHYNEVGSGAKTMICLHGGGPGASSWSNFTNNIEALAATHRVLLVDLPQFGKSDKFVIEGPRLTIVAGMLAQFMDAVGIDAADFIGNSYGGQVAIKLAIDAPERVNRLVIIGSAPVVHSLFCPMPLEGIKMIGSYYRGAGGPSFAKMKAIATTLVYDASNVTDEMIQERYQASIDPDAIKVNSGPPPERQDLTAEFPKVLAPTLVVWGMDDRFGALDIGLLMTRAFHNAEMHIFSKCGHWAQVEHAAEFNQLVSAFFGRDG